MEKLQQDILALLRRNARISTQEIADRLNSTVETVAALIKEMEEEHLILGYTAIIAQEAEKNEVRAIIEVQVQPKRDTGFDNIARSLARFPEVIAVHLVSGLYDLRLEVVGNSLQDVASFVASKLSSQDGVKATATHFLLKKYKEAGIELSKDEQHERLKITP
ncbi:MAG: Lrp/AsnC family transcriptional regulator [Lentisphaeria bacterium]